MTFESFKSSLHPFYEPLSWLGAVAGGLAALYAMIVTLVKVLPSRTTFSLTKDALYRTNYSEEWQERGRIHPKYKGGRFYGAIWRQVHPVIFTLSCALVGLWWKKTPFECARLRLERRILERNSDGEIEQNSKGEKKVTFYREGRGNELSQKIHFKNISDLLKLDEQITPYFCALQKYGGNTTGDPLQSLTEINVDSGFVAPMFLLSGLLPRLEDDWRVVGERFDVWQRIAKKHFPTLQDIVCLQSFLLDCWLLWGPSISLPKFTKDGNGVFLGLCTCWSEGKYVVAQYGYGDENNSICLVMDKLQAVNLINSWGEIARPAGAKGAGMQYPFALPANLKNGRLWFVDEKFEVNQGGIGKVAGGNTSFGSAIISAGHPGWDRAFSLKVGETTEIQINPLTERRYYSAYLWALFVTLNGDGVLLFRPGASKLHDEITDLEAFGAWRNMLTFFEHGNIADNDSYQFLEKHLAVKTARSLWTLAEKYIGYEEKPLFVYGGALDDLNCMTCQSVEELDQQLWHKIDEELCLLKWMEKEKSDEDKAQRIRSLIVMPSDSRHPFFGSRGEAPSVSLDDAQQNWKAHAGNALENVSGCRLFGVVAEYYRWLEKKSEKDTNAVKSEESDRSTTQPKPESKLGNFNQVLPEP